MCKLRRMLAIEKTCFKTMISKQYILLGSVIKQTDLRIINLTPANVCCLILVTKNIHFTICIADKKFTLYCARDEFISAGGGFQEGVFVNVLNM